MPHHIYKIIQAKVCIHLLLLRIFFHFCVYLCIWVFEYFSISLCGTTSTARSDQRWPEIWFPHCAPLLCWYKVPRSQIVSAFLNMCMCADISKWVVSVCPIWRASLETRSLVLIFSLPTRSLVTALWPEMGSFPYTPSLFVEEFSQEENNSIKKGIIAQQYCHKC